MIECPSAFYNDDKYLRQNYASNQHVLIPEDPWFNRGQVVAPKKATTLLRPSEHLVFGDATQIHDHLSYLSRSRLPADSNACFYSYRDSKGRSTYVSQDVLTMTSPTDAEESLHGLTLSEEDGLWKPSYLRFRHLEQSVVSFMDGHSEIFMRGDFKEKHLFTNY